MAEHSLELFFVGHYYAARNEVTEIIDGPYINQDEAQARVDVGKSRARAVVCVHIPYTIRSTGRTQDVISE
jgi:hypothetical protein